MSMYLRIGWQDEVLVHAVKWFLNFHIIAKEGGTFPIAKEDFTFASVQTDFVF